MPRNTQPASEPQPVVDQDAPLAAQAERQIEALVDRDAGQRSGVAVRPRPEAIDLVAARRARVPGRHALESRGQRWPCADDVGAAGHGGRAVVVVPVDRDEVHPRRDVDVELGAQPVHDRLCARVTRLALEPVVGVRLARVCTRHVSASAPARARCDSPHRASRRRSRRETSSARVASSRAASGPRPTSAHAGGPPGERASWSAR